VRLSGIKVKSLSRIIRASSGQDVSRCQGCFDCDIDMPNERDIPLGGLIQLAIMDDEEALFSRTLWSDSVLQASRGACKRGINLHAVIMALREEAKKRNIFR
jgi:heterodisulfide reductase subunit C